MHYHTRISEGHPCTCFRADCTCYAVQKCNNYLEIEPRHVPVSVEMPVLTPETAREYIDENTIGEPARWDRAGRIPPQ